MNKKIRLTSMIIAALMIVAMIPAFTLSIAADPVYVAEVTIGDGAPIQYESFTDAWAKVTGNDNTTGATLKLLKDTDMGATSPTAASERGAVVTDKTVIVDLNGFVLTPPSAAIGNVANTSTGTNHFWLNGENASLTIRDSNPEAEHWYKKEANGLYVWDDAAKDEANRTENHVMLPGGALTGGKQTKDGTNSQSVGSINNYCGTLCIEGGNFVGNEGVVAGAIKIHNGGGKISVFKLSGGMFVGNIITGSGSTNIRIVNGLDEKSIVIGGTFVGPGKGGTYGVNLYLGEGVNFVGSEAAGVYKAEIKTEAVKVDGVTHHMVVTGTIVPATCTQEGSTGARKCIDQHQSGVPCTYTDTGMSIPKLEHIEATDSAIAPTCTATGKTEGSHCSVCNSIIMMQEDVPALGHTAGQWTVTKEATEEEVGCEAKYCTVCNELIEEREIPVIGSVTEEATTQADTGAVTTDKATTDDKAGCQSVVGGAAGMLLVALLGGYVLCRKKEN